ncbi:conserved protein of unknown function [Ectopseudomonas oleovorans]|uniref:Uncharacterized protein n=1 Tax=Ectopseudomonas oleovorans TaxID=301 RepID=A0A653B0K6_ECTOL|nr:conserved protein of unknown function [Pseudomonas oleovorans]
MDDALFTQGAVGGRVKRRPPYACQPHCYRPAAPQMTSGRMGFYPYPEPSTKEAPCAAYSTT